MPVCNHPAPDTYGDPTFRVCGKPATDFFISHHPEGDLPHPRCSDHWRGSALETSPIVCRLTAEEFFVWEIHSH
jgi:hypothetical protein